MACSGMEEGCMVVGPRLRRDKRELLLALRGCAGAGNIGPIGIGAVEKGRGLFISNPPGFTNGGKAGGPGGVPCMKGGGKGAGPALYIGCKP